MTDLAIKAIFNRGEGSHIAIGEFVTKSRRNSMNIYQRSSNFLLGKHSTVHYSQAAINNANAKLESNRSTTPSTPIRPSGNNVSLIQKLEHPS
jgi:hypothetical protein